MVLVLVNLEQLHRAEWHEWWSWAQSTGFSGPYSRVGEFVSMARRKYPLRPAGMVREVFKYGMWKRDCVRPSGICGALERRVGGSPLRSSQGTSIAEAVFLSPDELTEGGAASRLLAVSYRPRVRMELGLRSGATVGNGPLQIVDLFGEEDVFNRVWPAFGLAGGGLEALLVEGAWMYPPWIGIPGFGPGNRMAGVQYEDWTISGAIARGLTGSMDAVIEEGLRELGPETNSDSVGPANSSSARGRVKMGDGGGGVAAVIRGNSGMSVSVTLDGPDVLVHSALWFDVSPVRFLAQLDTSLALQRIPASNLEIESGVLSSSKLQNCADKAFRSLQTFSRRPSSLGWVSAPWGPCIRGDEIWW